MRNLKFIAWGGVAVILAVFGGLWAGGMLPKNIDELPLAAKFGGPFQLRDQNNKAFDSKTLNGRPFAIFFGFTYCPEVCPTSLMEMTADIKSMGEDAEKMNFVFVTVDPERDTPEFLRTYLENFHPRIIGLTGTPKQIANVAKSYRVFYEKVKTKDGYTVNHTATTYLINAKGGLASTFAYGEKSKTRRKKLHALVNSTPSS